MSTSLAALQRSFLDAVLDGASLPAAVAPEDAVGFYRRNIASTQRSALAAAYPVLLRLVGEAFFAEAARLYAARFPSASGDLHAFGGSFGEFLEAYPHARSLPYLPDMARLEWAVHRCAGASDRAPLDVAMLARVPEAAQGSLRVRLAPCVARLCSRFPIVALWEANQPGRDGRPARHQGPDDVLVHRNGFDVVVAALDPPAARFLDALARGEPLEQASEALGAHIDRLPELVGRWVGDGVIAAFERGGAGA